MDNLSSQENIKETIGFARIQSPSSINTYKQCPRRYYYCYIEKIRTKPSIHLTRGKIAHSVLEDFFDLKPEKLEQKNLEFVLKIFIHDKLNQHWNKNKKELNSLGLQKAQLNMFLEETRSMVDLWLNDFLRKLKKEMQEHDFIKAWQRLTPTREKQYSSEGYGIRGFIDAIFEKDGKISVVDYKTSKSCHISVPYKLQLALYAMMYEEKHGKRPDKVGIYFLRNGEEFLDVNDDLIKLAKLECELIHTNTQTKDKEDYPKKPGPLCKWATGQCDFYGMCFGTKNGN